jgi:lipoprotein NlpI
MASRRPGAAQGFQDYLTVHGWKDRWAVYAVILGHLAARQTGDQAMADRFLKDSTGKFEETWPYPVLQYLRGEIKESKLIMLATDQGQRTEARCYLGIDQLLAGRKEGALIHFRWVKANGEWTYCEYPIAVAELERLEQSAEAIKP